VVFLALAGFLVPYKIVKLKAILISGVWKPSQNWAIGFFKYHPDLTPSKGSNLDHKQASSFNFTTVNQHFGKLIELLEEKYQQQTSLTLMR
jgi:hypothetical protein